jgi:hypothetical protein
MGARKRRASVLTDVDMGFVALEDSSVRSRAESIMAKDSVDGIQSSRRSDNVPGSTEERGD